MEKRKDNRMKKSLIFLALIGALLISACGPAATPTAALPTTAPEATEATEATDAPAPTEEPQGEPVTISYALWEQTQVPAHEQIIAAFEEQHPNINVEIQLVPWSEYWNKLQTALAGGEAYDVFWM